MTRVADLDSLAPVRSGQRWWRWHRFVGVFVVVHGLAHLVGASDAVGALGDDGSVEYFFGNWTLTHPVVLGLAGLVWTVLALGFVAVGAWIARSERQSPVVLAGLVVLLNWSAAACFIAVPAASVGLVVDVALLATAASIGSTVDAET